METLSRECEQMARQTLDNECRKAVRVSFPLCPVFIPLNAWSANNEYREKVGAEVPCFDGEEENND